MIIRKISNKATALISRCSWYNDFWGGAIKFWYIKKSDVDIVNLGSNSGKYAFDYSQLHIYGLNWALGPQSLLHDFNILKNYFSYIKPGGVVVITLSPFSSLFSQYNKDLNLKYYTFLHPATILNFDDQERIRALTIKSNPIKVMPFYCFKQIIKSVIKKMIPHKNSICDYDVHASFFINMWKQQFGIDDLESPLKEKQKKEQKERGSTLAEMFSFCIERDLKPILVIPPMHPLLSKRFSETFRENYIYSFVNKANTIGVPFYNFMDDERFGKDEFFQNSFFMNKKGAQYFTGELLKEIGVL